MIQAKERKSDLVSIYFYSTFLIFKKIYKKIRTNKYLIKIWNIIDIVDSVF